MSRWELLEPLQHRPPLPEPVLHAMCTLAVLWGWSRWAAGTLTGFYAICRPGEPLRARREHLVTSEDLLETGSEIFLRIRPLYDGSAGMYRRRWAGTRSSGPPLVEPQHRLTPGSLRGGGAVRAYRSGEALNFGCAFGARRPWAITSKRSQHCRYCRPSVPLPENPFGAPPLTCRSR